MLCTCLNLYLITSKKNDRTYFKLSSKSCKHKFFRTKLSLRFVFTSTDMTVAAVERSSG